MNLVYALFFCSGATALIYEVIWAKYLSLMFGSTVQAQTIVLAVFMGGLAAGNRLFGRRADWLRHPLASYGYVEILIGLYAFFFGDLYHLVDGWFIRVGAPLLAQSYLLLGVKAVISVALLLGPTILMGGTLPLLAAWLQQSTGDPGRMSARFYSLNSLGAVCGSAIGGFYLIETWGVVAALQATALLNVIVGTIAVGASRRMAGEFQEGTKENGESPMVLETESEVARGLGYIVALTGAISMSLEVLAARSLSLIVGASSQAFALVLIAFILGIGLGAAWVSSPRWVQVTGGMTISRFLLGAGVAVGLYVLCIEEWVLLYSAARTGLAGNGIGYFYHQGLIALIAIVVLGVPAALMGAVLPLSIRLVSQRRGGMADQLGRLLTWNTLGAVGGVLLTGFVLMPLVGLRNALIVLATILVLLAARLAWGERARGVTVVLVLWAGAFLWMARERGAGWQQILGSGVFRLRTLLTREGLKQRRDLTELYYYKDGADATVSVETSTEGGNKGQRVLRINGKPDASTQGDLSTQYLLAHLPLFARPDAKEVFVLGFGSGITAGALLGHPVERITVAENCQPVLEAARYFEAWNRGVLTNERTRVMREDARTVLKLEPQTYDVIISEPSNPWVAGIGGVFSQEFYQLAANRLRPRGVMAQWFHVYEMHDAVAMLVLRTFQSVFPHVEIWEPQTGDIVLLGARAPWSYSMEMIEGVYRRPDVRSDLERIHLKTPRSIFLRQVASQRIAPAVAGDGAIQSDFFPVLEYAAPRAFFVGAGASELYLFDERTWQSGLASPEKKQWLLDLGVEEMHGPFREFGTSSADLQQYVNWRAEQAALGQTNPVYSVNPYVPIIFRTPESFPKQVASARGSNATLNALAGALAMIYAEPSQRDRGLQVIEELLRATKTPEAGKRPDWRAGFYAATAARIYLEKYDVQAAVAVLEQGSRLEPNDPQVRFLKRLVQQNLSLKP